MLLALHAAGAVLDLRGLQARSRSRHTICGLVALIRSEHDPAAERQTDLGNARSAGRSIGLLVLLLAGTETLRGSGISPPGRRRLPLLDAAADCGVLLAWTGRSTPHCPAATAGRAQSPALISPRGAQGIGAPHPGGGPGCRLRTGRCPPCNWPSASPLALSTGSRHGPREGSGGLLALGRRWANAGDGQRATPPPLAVGGMCSGGNSTPRRALRPGASGAAGLVSAGLKQPAHGLKRRLVERACAPLVLWDPRPKPGGASPGGGWPRWGIPMQPAAAGVLLAAARAGLPVLCSPAAARWRRCGAVRLPWAPAGLRPQLAAWPPWPTTALGCGRRAATWSCC